MALRAVVRQWSDDDGWGVLDCAETPGGCWVHYSAVAVPGHGTLAVGSPVWLEWERAEQDGYRFRATRAWPVGADPAQRSPPVIRGGAYSSRLDIAGDCGESYPNADG